MYIQCEINPPPPLLDSYFFPKGYLWGRARRRRKNLKPFYCNFVNFKSIGEKIRILFTNLGKNMHTFYQFRKKYTFSPLFHPFSIIFSPNMIFVHNFAPPPGGGGGWGGGQTEKYAPLGTARFIISYRNSLFFYDTQLHIHKSLSLNNLLSIEGSGTCTTRSWEPTACYWTAVPSPLSTTRWSKF